MAEKEKSMVEKILDTERAGYAYFYPQHQKIWQIFLAVIFMMLRR